MKTERSQYNQGDLSSFASATPIPNQRQEDTRELKPVMRDSDIIIPPNHRRQQQPEMSESVHPDQQRPKRPTKKGTQRVLNRFESASQDGWKILKKIVGSYRQQIKKQQQYALGSIERQAEINSLTPMIMAMHFSRDENNERRIPVFLNNLAVVVTKDDDNNNRSTSRITKRTKKYRSKVLFKITVQYGTGPGKITWSIYRRYWDFVKLHYRYKKSYTNDRRMRDGSSVIRSRTRPPKFPSIPRHHFRRQKGKDKQPTVLNRTPTSSPGTESLVDASSLENHPRVNAESLLDEDAVMDLMYHAENAVNTTQPDVEEEEVGSREPSIGSSQVMEVVKADRSVLLALENYLNQFIHSIKPCGHINQLCKFLEISALGIQLAAQYPTSSHHGKEGFAVFQSRTDRDPKQRRQFLQDGLVCSIPTTGGRRRRKPKWFIVRESYVLCVDDPSEVK